MPGRQAHGRSLTSQPKAKSGGSSSNSNNKKKSKARSQKNALNAFGIAQENFPVREKRTPRARVLEPEVDKRKHARDDEDDDEEGDDDEEDGEMPERKRVKRPSRRGGADGDAEFGSDSEGNEWQLGGLAEDDEDSEIESDEAFGESDEEKFGGYAFRGTKSTKSKVGKYNLAQPHTRTGYQLTLYSARMTTANRTQTIRTMKRVRLSEKMPSI